MQFIFLLNCMIVKISSFVVFHFAVIVFFFVYFLESVFLIHEDLKIFIKPVI